MKKNKMPEKEGGYKFSKALITPLYKFYFRPKVIGKENIPKNGSFLLCGNHKNVHDQCSIMISTKRVIHYMAKKEYFDGKMGWFFRFAGQIPVNREIHDEDAKGRAYNLLKSGGALGIFPEGTRNKTKDLLLPFKFGAVSLAKKTDSPIVPFAICGDYHFRSKNLVIKIGEPFKVTDMELEDANKLLESKVRDILLELMAENEKSKKS